MKERIKSFVLALLMLISIGLTSITWIDERLWPDGYSLFVNVKEWPIINKFFKDSYSQPLENLSKARKIVIADGFGSSAVFYNGDKAFNDVYGDIKELMNGVQSGEIVAVSTSNLKRENVREMLNEQIMYAYVNYSVAMPPSFFGQLMGIEDSEAFSQAEAVRDFFILPTGEKSLELIAIDSKKDNVLRYEINYGGTEALIGKFTEYTADIEPDDYCVMALQMNMDTQSPDDPVQMKIVLDSFLVLETASTANAERIQIESTNPIAEGVPEEVVKCFSYSPNSLYRYVDGEGTTVYLENDSSLKFYKNGIVEYEATSAEHGILLSGEHSTYELLNGAIRFAGKVYSSAVPDGELPINVSSDINLFDSEEIKFVFDYYYGGTPIATVMEDAEMNHAVEITVSGGRIVKFRILLREFKETGISVDNMNIYGAIDKIAALYAESEEAVKIDDMFPAYAEDGKSGVLMPCWVGYAEGSRIVITE